MLNALHEVLVQVSPRLLRSKLQITVSLIDAIIPAFASLWCMHRMMSFQERARKLLRGNTLQQCLTFRGLAPSLVNTCLQNLHSEALHPLCQRGALSACEGQTIAERSLCRQCI